jgi:hypothetical protein
MEDDRWITVQVRQLFKLAGTDWRFNCYIKIYAIQTSFGTFGALGSTSVALQNIYVNDVLYCHVQEWSNVPLYHLCWMGRHGKELVLRTFFFRLRQGSHAGMYPALRARLGSCCWPADDDGDAVDEGDG